MQRILSLGVLSVAVLFGSGCASSPNYYADDGYRGAPQAEYCRNCGTVVGIERARMQQGTSGGGALLGAIVGGALGNQVGKGDGRKAATIAGAVIGGAVGNDIERDGKPDRRGFMIAVRMESGRVERFFQPEPYGLRTGDRVVIINGQVQRSRG
jgi:outer membrane lipoprotein SlyB